jgi:N,N'-diacetylchitobiose non-reducing end deacetylase
MKPGICDFFPIPELLKAKSLLVIQPHPDDMEIGAGATLARMIRSGTEVSCLTVTDGAAGTYDSTIKSSDLAKTRRREAERSAEILGLKNLLWLDYADGGILPYEEVRAKITRIIRQLKPAAIMVCDPWLPYEVHSDHIRTGLATAEAAFLSGMPHFCPADIHEDIQPHPVDTFGFYYTAYPNTFIEVTDTWQVKLEAIDCHKSQFAPDQAEMLKTLLTMKASNYAKEQGCKMVETFKVLSSLHMHIFGEAWQC